MNFLLYINLLYNCSTFPNREARAEKALKYHIYLTQAHVIERRERENFVPNAPSLLGCAPSVATLEGLWQ